MGACRSLPWPLPQAVDLALGGLQRLGRKFAEAVFPAELGHVDAGDPAEGGGILEGVAAQAVGAVQGQAGGLAGRVQSLDHRALGVLDHLGAHVGRDAAHGIMGRGLDGDGLIDGVDLQVVQGQVVDLRQALQDLLPAQVAQVEVDVILAADAAAFVDLGLFRAGNDVARRQFHLGRRVGLHETLALVIDDIGPLAAGGLGEQDAVLVQPGGVELDEFHVLQRQAGFEHQGHAVAGVGMGVGRDLPGAAVAAGGQQNGAGVKNVQAAVADIPGHQAPGHVLLDQQRQHLEFVEKKDIVLQALLVEGMQQNVAGDVLGETGARRGVAAEGALVDPAVVGARKGDAHVFEFVDGLAAPR